MVQEGRGSGHQIVDGREKEAYKALEERMKKPVTDDELSNAIHEILSYNYADELTDFCANDDIDLSDHILNSMLTLQAWNEQRRTK